MANFVGVHWRGRGTKAKILNLMRNSWANFYDHEEEEEQTGGGAPQSDACLPTNVPTDTKTRKLGPPEGNSLLFMAALVGAAGMKNSGRRNTSKDARNGNS